MDIAVILGICLVVAAVGGFLGLCHHIDQGYEHRQQLRRIRHRAHVRRVMRESR